MIQPIPNNPTPPSIEAGYVRQAPISANPETNSNPLPIPTEFFISNPTPIIEKDRKSVV